MHRLIVIGALLISMCVTAEESAAQTLVPPPPSGNLEQLYKWIWFAPNGVGYVASEFSLVRTGNAGAAWRILRETLYDRGPGIEEIFFVNQDTAFVFGWAGLWRTTDGGASFERFARAVPAIDDPTDRDELREGFFFIDANHGWALGDRQLLITDDGGRTWRQRRLRKREFGSDEPARLWLFDAQHAIAVGADRVFATEDEGIHWSAVPNSPRLDEVQCAPDRFCAGRTLRGTVVYASSDAGKSWQAVTPGLDPDRDDIAAFQVISASALVLVGTHNDQGRSERAAHGAQAVKPTAAPFRGLLLRWNGATWERHEYPEITRLRAIHFVSATEAWASADFNGIIHSTDGGQSWTFVPDYYRQAAARTPAPTPLYIMATPPPTP